MNKIALLFIALALNGLIFAQEKKSYNFSVNHLAISVKDVNRSADFYMKVLNLTEITNRSKIPGIRWFVLGDGRELHLISVIKEPVTINKALHMGFSTTSFDEFIKKLTELKIPYSDWPGKANTINTREDGIKQIFFQDPDGYWLEVNNEAR
jgi:lactoylglutathione lyase